MRSSYPGRHVVVQPLCRPSRCVFLRSGRGKSREGPARSPRYPSPAAHDAPGMDTPQFGDLEGCRRAESTGASGNPAQVASPAWRDPARSSSNGHVSLSGGTGRSVARPAIAANAPEDCELLASKPVRHRPGRAAQARCRTSMLSGSTTWTVASQQRTTLDGQTWCQDPRSWRPSRQGVSRRYLRSPARGMEVDAAQTDGIPGRHRERRGQQCAEQQHLGAHAGDQLGIDPLRLHAIGRDRHGEARVACRPMHAAAPARYGCSMRF